MLRSLNAGVTGLGNEQTAIDVISNNISNVNTVGYKSQRVEFQNLLEQTLGAGSAPQNGRGGTNPEQVGLGVTTGAITTIETQGALNYTGKNTDLALQGDGYFVVNDGTQDYYTRDGSFDFDSSGTFIHADGMKVMGWTAVNGVINPQAEPSSITIPRGMTLAPKATQNVDIKGNMQATASDISLAGVIQGSTTAGSPSPASPVSVALRMLNSKGELITGTLKLTQEGSTQTWDAAFTPDSGSAAVLTTGSAPIGLGKITFDDTGKVSDNALTPLTLTYLPTDGAQSQSYNLDPSTLQIRTDVTSSQIGFAAPLSTDPSGASLPSGDVGICYAGSYTMTVNWFDATGQQHTGSLVMQRDLDAQNASAGTTAPIEWRSLFTYNDPTIKDDTTGSGAGAGPIPIDMGTVSFDQYGMLASNGLNAASIKYTNGSADSTLAFDPGQVGDVNGLTQFQTDSTALVSGQDGFAAGSLTGLSVDPSGIISGVFNNGQVRQLAQVAVANFDNPEGLVNTGNNLLQVGNNSGDAQIGTAETAGRGSIAEGNLEQSNVDLAQQFADLIVAQRGFQANARIITTSDQILQELIQLKQ